jgi:hypothetical protein
MQIEMVETTRGPLPRVALEKREHIVKDDADATTVQVEWNVIGSAEVVKRDGYVTYKLVPADLSLALGMLRAGG